jgi:hypothetical protein
MDFFEQAQVTVAVALATAVVVALIVCPLLLRAYGRSLQRHMSAASPRHVAPSPSVMASWPPPSSGPSPAAVPQPATPQPVRLITFDAPAPTVAGDRARRRRQLSVLSYSAGGLAFAAVATILLFIIHGFDFLPLRTTVVIVAYSTPILIMIGVVYGVGSTVLARSAMAYAGIFLAMGVINLAVTEMEPASATAPFLLGVLYGLPSALLLALFNRRFRSIAPVLVIISTLAVGGAVLAPPLLVNESVLSATVSTFVSLGLGAVEALVLFCTVGLVVLGWFGWKLSRLMADAYQRQSLSHERLIIDSIWIFQSVIVAWSFQELAILAVAPFVAYKLVSLTGMTLAESTTGSAHQPALLLLRVFASDSRSQQLLDNLAHQWSYLGPIRLISAPDVARHVINHHTVLLFLSGRLTELFIRERSELHRRLGSLTSRRDPDGHFRMEPFFCQGESWRWTVRHLITTSDITVMDLRAFDRTREGCIYEIEALLDLVPLDRLLILVDHTTNTGDLHSVLERKWPHLAPDSPNRGAASPDVRVLPVTDSTDTPVDHLVASALGPVR